eukprot:17695-Heterococcus_DN1.PRE.3
MSGRHQRRRQHYAALKFALFTAVAYQILLVCVTAVVAAATATISLSLSLCDACLIQDGLCTSNHNL